MKGLTSLLREPPFSLPTGVRVSLRVFTAPSIALALRRAHNVDGEEVLMLMMAGWQGGARPACKSVGKKTFVLSVA